MAPNWNRLVIESLKNRFVSEPAQDSQLQKDSTQIGFHFQAARADFPFRARYLHKASLISTGPYAVTVLRASGPRGGQSACLEGRRLLGSADSLLTGPDARARALDIAGQHPPARVSRAEAIAEITEGLDAIGDASPECPPEVS